MKKESEFYFGNINMCAIQINFVGFFCCCYLRQIKVFFRQRIQIKYTQSHSKTQLVKIFNSLETREQIRSIMRFFCKQFFGGGDCEQHLMRAE